MKIDRKRNSNFYCGVDHCEELVEKIETDILFDISNFQIKENWKSNFSTQGLIVQSCGSQHCAAWASMHEAQQATALSPT